MNQKPDEPENETLMRVPELTVRFWTGSRPTGSAGSRPDNQKGTEMIPVFNSVRREKFNVI